MQRLYRRLLAVAAKQPRSVATLTLRTGATYRLKVTCASPSTRTARFATMASAAAPRALVFDKPGEPLDVLELRHLPDISPCGPNQVEVQFLQSPINPSDVNTVQGKYPIGPPLPGGVPGHEGVAEVVAVGEQVSGLSPGDWVVPMAPALGTWRTRGVYDASQWHRVPKEIGLAAAATIVINPPTAVAMLELVQLQPGDTVAQNGATSAVGEAVIQVAKARGLRTINVIRDRPDWDATVSHLKALGADLVTTEERLKDDLKASGLPAPLLGLNCVGGTAANAVTRILKDGGTLVTYGGMSMQPVTAPTAAMIFKDITFRGFWLSGRWAAQQGPAGRAAVLDRVAAMYGAGQLKPPSVRTFPLSQWREAFEELGRAHRGHKVLLDLAAADDAGDV